MPVAVHSQAHFRYLAGIVRNNLEHQQNWADLQVHGLDEDNVVVGGGGPNGQFDRQAIGETPCRLPRIMISGLPQRRLYIHPDEQIEILRAERILGQGQRIPQPPEYEWVLPMHLSEKPTISQFADVFDSLEVLPPGADKPGETVLRDATESTDVTEATSAAIAIEQQKLKQWRATKRGKRILLAIVQDDSTVIYYFMHDGIVKPRQN